MQLREYLSLRQLTLAQAAEQIGCSVSALHRWTEGAVPRKPDMQRLMQWSKGAVMPNDFYTEGAHQ